MTDPRLPAFLAFAAERRHPLYAAAALRLAREAGDTAAMEAAIQLGALDWRPEPVVRAWTEGERALDLFCGAGGATKGLQEAGYHVTGVDIRPQPRYCGDHFIQADAMEIDWAGYDLIWASPPCQRYSRLTPDRTRNDHPDLLPGVLDRLRAQSTLYIVENVPGTEMLMRSPLFLCGSMFGLNIRRHRWFEIGNADVFFLLPPCNHSSKAVLISGCDSEGREPSVAVRAAAINIDWMVDKELDQAIPPAYSRFLGTAVKELSL